MKDRFHYVIARIFPTIPRALSSSLLLLVLVDAFQIDVWIKFIFSHDIMEQTFLLDFPIPNEIIEKVMSYLSPEDLLVLAAVGTERLKKCTFSALHKKLCGNY